MERIGYLLALTGVMYLAFLVWSGEGPRDRYLLRLRIRFGSGAGERTKRLQRRLDEAGLPFSASHLHAFRYIAALLCLLWQAAGVYIRQAPLTWSIVMVPALILAVTGPAWFLPFGWLLEWLRQRASIRKDSELISFIRLYENNRLRKRGYVQFGSFCGGMAHHFYYLRQDLYDLSERAVDEGAERAIEWFCGTFPSGHPFIQDIRSILLATEAMDDDEEAAHYLREQGSIIAKISSDQYLKKWSFIGDVSTIINVIPSIATFLMIVSLAMQYILLIKDNFNGVGLFQ